MTILNAIILGFVQGVAEFLPISSSGHLSIVSNLFHLSTAENGHLFFDVLLHLATLISICFVYWKDIVQMVSDVLAVMHIGPSGQKRSDFTAARLFIMIVFASIPLVLALMIDDVVEGLYYKTIAVGIMLILTGCILYVADKFQPGKKTARSITVWDALIIGLCQCVATIPGLSRSGVTITAGIATGLDRQFAVKFSFLMSIPAVLGANLLAIIDAAREGIDWACVPAYIAGMIVAMLTGIASISLLRYISNRGKFGGFAYYCWLAGSLSIILTLIF